MIVITTGRCNACAHGSSLYSIATHADPSDCVRPKSKVKNFKKNEIQKTTKSKSQEMKKTEIAKFPQSDPKNLAIRRAAKFFWHMCV